MSRSVEAVSRWCRLTLVSMVSTRVDPCRPVSEGGLTVYTRGGRVIVSIVSSVRQFYYLHDVINGHYLLSGTPQSS